MEEVETADNVRKEIKSKFGSVVQATSDNLDYTFDAVVNNIKVQDGKLVITIFADPIKSFDLVIHDIKSSAGQWVLHTDNGLWAFRVPETDRAKRFLKKMKGEGVND